MKSWIKTILSWRQSWYRLKVISLKRELIRTKIQMQIYWESIMHLKVSRLLTNLHITWQILTYKLCIQSTQLKTTRIKPFMRDKIPHHFLHRGFLMAYKKSLTGKDSFHNKKIIKNLSKIILLDYQNFTNKNIFLNPTCHNRWANNLILNKLITRTNTINLLKIQNSLSKRATFTSLK